MLTALPSLKYIVVAFKQFQDPEGAGRGTRLHTGSSFSFHLLTSDHILP